VSAVVRVAAAVILRADGAVLLAQRPPGKPYAGYWEFPGGKLEPGETPAHALARELVEELGIGVVRAAPWLVQEFVYPHAHVELNFFRVFAFEGEPVSHDGQAFAWQDPRAIDVAPLLPANTRVLAALKTNLGYSEIPLTLRTEPASREGRHFLLPISVTLPASALTFVPEGKVKRATADVSIGAMDDSGRVSDVVRQEAAFTIPLGVETTTLDFTTKLYTRKGNQRIVVNLRDRLSGKMGTAKADVRIE